jgi:transcription antitermination factor NusG
MAIELWMVFEAVSNDKEKVEESLEDHIEGLEEHESVEISEVNWEETEKVKNPHPDLDEGYSRVVETVVEVEDFNTAVEITINYGPTYVQIEGPENFNLTLKDSQEALQKVADTMHNYAQMGAGGVLISKSGEE